MNAKKEKVFIVGFADSINRKNITASPCVEIVHTETAAIDICRGSLLSYIRHAVVDADKAVMLNTAARAIHSCRIHSRPYSYYS